jgi:hypothetical protein
MSFHLHKRLSEPQTKLILEQYISHELSLSAALAQLGVKRRRFFLLLKTYRHDPKGFSLKYERESPKRLSHDVERKIIAALKDEQKLIHDKRIPIRTYNYASVKDRLEQESGIHVSRTTIVNRAKDAGLYLPKPKARIHDREVLTNNIGELVQHDSSFHLWSPYAASKWYLITSIDDHSRLFLYADLVERESSWKHILAIQSVVLRYGAPLKYYPDQHSIFRFVARRDSEYMKWNTKTDGTTPQWRQVLERCGIGVCYALSPQAKGKVERPYGWLQDRIVRTCAREEITTLERARDILQEEIRQYNDRRIHSTTKEIPRVRFERAAKEGRTFFRPHAIPNPYDPVKDVFCLKTERVVDSYRKISLNTCELTVPGVPPRQTVTLHLVPDPSESCVEVRIWWQMRLMSTQTVKADLLRGVHF